MFGSIAHVHVPVHKRVKLDDRSHKCILLGVDEETKAYRSFDLVARRIITSRDVIFEEGGRWGWKMSEAEIKQKILVMGDDESITEESGGEDTSEDTDKITEEAERGSPEFSPETDLTSEHVEQTSSRRNHPGWMSDYVSGEGLYEEESSEINIVFQISNDNPVTYGEAVKEKKCQDAMRQ